jgi:RHS repeat-associated protein
VPDLLPADYRFSINKVILGDNRKSALSQSLFSLLIVLVFSSSLASAQAVYSGNNNLPPFGSFSGSHFDIVTLQNGNLHFSIPLVELPQRSGRTLSLRAVYNTPAWQKVFMPPPNQGQQGHYQILGDHFYSGLRIVDNFSWRVDTIQRKFTCQNGNDLVQNYIVTEPDGTKHPFALNQTATQVCSSNLSKGPATDGSGVVFDAATNVITLKDGTNGFSEDTNGNLASAAADTLNRPLYTTASGPIVTFTTPLGQTTGTGAQYTTLTYRDSSGTPQAYRLDYAGFDVSTGFCSGVPNCVDTNKTAIVPVRLTLPTGRYYQFTYVNNSGMQLQRIDFPSGGYIIYTHYTSNPINCHQPNYVVGPGEGYPAPSDCRYSILSRTVGQGGTTATWNYALQADSGTTNSGTVTDPAGNDEVHQYDDILGETQVRYYSGSASSGALLKTIDNTYAYESDPNGPSVINTRLIRQDTVLENGQTKRVETDYETFQTPWEGLHISKNITATRMNVIERREYDYGAVGSNSPGSLLRRTDITYLHNSNSACLLPNIVDRVLQTTVYDSTVNTCKGLLQPCAQTTYEYDNYSHAGQPMLSSSAVQHDANYGTSFTTRGNVTAVQQWRNTDGALLTTTNQYDDAGNLISTIDPLSHKTAFDYTDSWSNATCAPSGQGKAYPTSITNALSQITTRKYNSCTGSLASTTDPNLLTTSTTYDLMGRTSQVNLPDGGQTTFSYQESSLPLSDTVTTKINSTQNKVGTRIFDGLGRATQSQLTSDPQGTVFTDTTYDALGRVSTVSNPYRSGTDATTTAGITTYAYDALGRKISETYPDSSVLTTAYCGPNTLVADPTGKWRRSRTNALGQLVEVDEPNAVGATVATTGCPGNSEPTWVTSYTNDVLGNLTNVLQNASHPRTFTYDSLSHLLTSSNPETGAITYTYNNDGVMATKKDARLITATYNFDALHRTTGVTYSNSDPALTFTYDQAACLGLSTCQNIGHRTSMTDGAGSEARAYQTDATNLRSIHKEQRTTNSSPSNITKSTTYYMNLAGGVTQLVYPTGRTVNYTYDAADRPSTAQDSTNGITYATGKKTPPANTNCVATAVCYTPQGSEYAVSIGQTTAFNGVNITETYNSRLQPSELKAASSVGNAMDITYNFVDPATSGNAGHVYGITNNLNIKRSQVFTYDQLNRITSAGTTDTTTAATCWGNKYSYDAWSNLLSQVAWTPTYNACTESTMAAVTADGNNHISGLAYDTSGNTLTDGNNTYTWDGESQIKTAGGVTYAYDGDGRRAAKVSSKLYWYGSGGEILAETNAAGAVTNEYVFFGGRRVALVPSTGTALYYAEDFLGSSRVMVQSTGTLCYDSDFTPFGAERAITNTCTQNAYKFEGKERDAETQNDDFGAREYSWRMGRWLSSDWSAVPVAVPYANLTNPQTLNLYSMVGDDPESFADLDGHTIAINNDGISGLCIAKGNQGETCAQSTVYASEKKGTATAQKKKEPSLKQKVLKAVAEHPKTVKAIFYTINAVTILSGIIDGGASEAAVPEELAAEEGVEALAEKEVASEAEAAVEEQVEAASEKTATDMAKQIERDLGKDARRDFHDLKEGGDRTLKQLKEDAKSIYEAGGRTPPKWMQ